MATGSCSVTRGPKRRPRQMAARAAARASWRLPQSQPGGMRLMRPFSPLLRRRRRCPGCPRRRSGLRPRKDHRARGGTRGDVAASRGVAAPARRCPAGRDDRCGECRGSRAAPCRRLPVPAGRAARRVRRPGSRRWHPVRPSRSGSRPCRRLPHCGPQTVRSVGRVPSRGRVSPGVRRGRGGRRRRRRERRARYGPPIRRSRRGSGAAGGRSACWDR